MTDDVDEESTLGQVLRMQDTELGEKRAFSPTLPTLRAQQRDLRRRFRDGFESRRDILTWAHAASAVSAGRLPDDVFTELVCDPWMVAVCLANERAREAICGENAPSIEQVRSERERVIQDSISPAYQKALGLLRDSSGDVIDRDEGVPNIDKQAFLGLRPRLHQRAVEQHRTLLAAYGEGDWGSIDTQAAAGRWADEVGYAAPGRMDPEFIGRVRSPFGEWLSAFVSGGDDTITTLLAEEVMPPFNAALRDAVDEGEEKAQKLDTSPDVETGPRNAY